MDISTIAEKKIISNGLEITFPITIQRDDDIIIISSPISRILIAPPDDLPREKQAYFTKYLYTVLRQEDMIRKLENIFGREEKAYEYIANVVARFLEAKGRAKVYVQTINRSRNGINIYVIGDKNVFPSVENRDLRYERLFSRFIRSGNGNDMELVRFLLEERLPSIVDTMNRLLDEYSFKAVIMENEVINRNKSIAKEIKELFSSLANEYKVARTSSNIESAFLGLKFGLLLPRPPSKE